MCREDLQLGRGRKLGKSVTSSTTALSILPANERRVALLVSFVGAVYFDAIAGSSVIDFALILAGDATNLTPCLVLSPGSGPTVLRIEDLGQLVCGAFTVEISNPSTAALIALTEILTDVEAPAITR